jgi:hypothetical protein
MTIRLAMWSGPRNLSTAMMRAWENRPDTRVVDEPFYACYLEATGIDHPMREEVLASQPTEWARVAESLSEAQVPEAVFYQKHMTHHMLEGVDLSWTRQLRHCFLIRDPRYVVASYGQKRSTISEEDIGLTRQLSLYEEISALTDQEIPVLDARRFLLDPETALRRLCAALDIPFYTQMLSWPAGRRSSDGVWAPHWYQAVEASTGFQRYEERELDLTPNQEQVAQAARPAYEKLLARA